ncbi:hypothetical protein Tco_0499963 [Tanacetum coccineum]
MIVVEKEWDLVGLDSACYRWLQTQIAFQACTVLRKGTLSALGESYTSGAEAGGQLSSGLSEPLDNQNQIKKDNPYIQDLLASQV